MSVSMGNTYQDIHNIGEIFGVQPRAKHLIASMLGPRRLRQRSRASCQSRSSITTAASPPRSPWRALAMINALLSLGGGTNIFGSTKQSWTSASWEQVVAAKPQCIIINDYGTPAAAQKEKFLETFVASKDLAAVKIHCFLVLSYDEVTPSPGNARAVMAIARWLHPSAFGRSPDSS
jgi:iron complex transport system substrate-binding protein